MALKKIIAARRHLDTLAVLLAIIGTFFISISPGIVNVLFPTAAACTIFAGNWRYKWQVIEESKMIFWGCILLCLFVVGITYGYVPWRESLHGLGKYNKLIYLLFLPPLFVEAKWRRLVIYALLLGVLSNAIVYIFNMSNISMFSKITSINSGYFVHPIYVTALTAFSLFILANLALDEKKYRLVYVMLFLFLCYVLFFIYVQRTGYLIFFVLMFVLFWQRWRWRGLLVVSLVMIMLAGFFYHASPVFGYRISEGIDNLIRYKHNKERDTSWGLRVDFAKYSLKMIEQRPIFGNGTGSFPLIYKQSGGPVLPDKPILGHPHNEYILIAFQLGIVGLLIFLWWIVVQWRDSFKLPLFEQRAVQGLIIAFLITGFCNVSLYVNTTGMAYIIFLSVFFASGFLNSSDNLHFVVNKK